MPIRRAKNWRYCPHCGKRLPVLRACRECQTMFYTLNPLKQYCTRSCRDRHERMLARKWTRDVN
jgi:hypothetical protein